MNDISNTAPSAESEENNELTSMVEIEISKLKETSTLAHKYRQNWLSEGKPFAIEIQKTLADWVQVHNRLKHISFFLLLKLNVRKNFFLFYYKVKWGLVCIVNYLVCLFMFFIWLARKTILYIVSISILAAITWLIFWLLSEFDLY